MAPKTALKKSEKIEWIPQAIIRKPVSYFQKRLGLKFIEDSDNLDYFEGTLPPHESEIAPSYCAIIEDFHLM